MCGLRPSPVVLPLSGPYAVETMSAPSKILSQTELTRVSVGEVEPIARSAALVTTTNLRASLVELAGIEPASNILSLEGDYSNAVVALVGLEPTNLSVPDFESGVFTNFTTRPQLVPAVGIEPTTFALQVRCSTY